MIRANLALFRQAQEMFRAHLVGVFSWEQVEFSPRTKRLVKPMADMSRRERRNARRDRPEGKYEQEVRLQFGIWEILIQSPADHPPLGNVVLTGAAEVSGPLDPATWDRIGQTIKQKTEELRDVEEIEWS